MPHGTPKEEQTMPEHTYHDINLHRNREQLSAPVSPTPTRAPPPQTAQVSCRRSWHGLWSEWCCFASLRDHHKPCQDRTLRDREDERDNRFSGKSRAFDATSGHRWPKNNMPSTPESGRRPREVAQRIRSPALQTSTTLAKRERTPRQDDCDLALPRQGGEAGGGGGGGTHCPGTRTDTMFTLSRPLATQHRAREARSHQTC